MHSRARIFFWERFMASADKGATEQRMARIVGEFFPHGDPSSMTDYRIRHPVTD
jgi:hypothetical protein